MPYFSDYRQRKGLFEDQQIEDQTQLQATIVPPPWSALGLPLRFSLTLGQSQGTDPSLVWSVNTPNPYRPFTDMAISFPNQNLVMTNVSTTSTYPTNIYVQIDNFTGYLDINGNQTGNVVRFSIKQVLLLATTPATYSITYQSQQTSWYLSRNQGVLNFRVYYDDSQTPVPTPLPFELPLQLEFRKYPFDRKLEQTDSMDGIQLLSNQMVMFY